MKKRIFTFMIMAAALSVTACQQEKEEKLNTALEQQAETPKENTETTETKENIEQNTTQEPVSLEERAFMEFEAQDLSGETINQDVFKDKKLTMVNIWGTFCGPCIQEMPYLGELNKEYQDKGFQIVGVVADGIDQEMNIDPAQVEKAKGMVEQTGADYLHILPTKDLIEKKLIYTQVIPETIFVDSTGQQVGDPVIGSNDKAGWSNIIDEKLAEIQ